MSLGRLLDDLPDGPAVFVGDEVVTRDDLAAERTRSRRRWPASPREVRSRCSCRTVQP